MFVPSIDETLNALECLVQSGKVNPVDRVQISNETRGEFHNLAIMTFLEVARREGLPVVASVQNPYSLLNRTFEVGLSEVAHRESVGLLAYSMPCAAFGVLYFS